MNFKSSTLTATVLGLSMALVHPKASYAEGTEPTATDPNAPGLFEDPERTSWGIGMGMVFSSVPISTAKFTAPISELHYSYCLGDPKEDFRAYASMGAFGFAMIIPVPKISMEAIIGRPTQDIQGKFGVGGFYDFIVGGHGGINLEAGIRIKNRVDITATCVPIGTEGDRDYLDFIGLADKEKDENNNNKPDYLEPPFVKVPYYGVLISLHY